MSDTINDTKNNEAYEPLLSAKPVEKAYQKPNIDAASIPLDLPEQSFEKPKLNFEPNRATEQPIEENHKTQSSSPENSFNPAMSNLASKDKRIVAENMADSAIGGYSFICERLLVPFAQINTQKIEEQIATGEMSEEITFVVDEEGNRANIRQYAAVFNPTVESALKVDEEFKDRIREPLVRICLKRDIGMTDEAFVGLELSKDAIAKLMILVDLKKSTKTVTDMIIEQTSLMRGQYVTPAQHTPSPAPIVQESPENIIVKEQVIVTPESKFSNDFPKKEVKTSVFAEKEEIQGMPKFGNPEIMKHLAEVANEGTPTIVPAKIKTTNAKTSVSKSKSTNVAKK